MAEKETAYQGFKRRLLEHIRHEMNSEANSGQARAWAAMMEDRPDEKAKLIGDAAKCAYAFRELKSLQEWVTAYKPDPSEPGAVISEG